MKTLQLPFDPKNEMFMGNFKSVSREFIRLLKDIGLLEKVTEEFIDMLPETFDVSVNTDPMANTQDIFWVFFYLDVKATEEMKISTKEYLSRDINIEKEDDTLDFSIIIMKDSKFVKKADDQEIVFEF